MRCHFSAFAALAAWIALTVVPPARAASLRFHGFGDDDVDRVKIPIDDPENPNDEPGPPVDVGAGDFTIELWLKGMLAENANGVQNCGGDGWIYGNIVIDRDRWEPGGRDYGISLGDGRATFGVAGTSSGTTICGGTLVLDGDWHHLAFDRRAADGRLRIFVDGVLDAQGTGPLGDVSYPGNETPQGTNCDGGPCFGSDPFVVFGAEKHDAGPSFPSFSGWLDEVRFSNVIRYAGTFTPPAAPFVPDASTKALYHFDEGSGELVGDSSGAQGGPSHGERRFGGTPIPGPEWSGETPFAPATGAPGTRAESLTFEAHPNPSLGQILFFVRFGEPVEAPLALAIHDVSGREVRRLEGVLARGSALVVWDGRATGGETARPGAYFAKLEAEGAVVSRKIIVR